MVSQDGPARLTKKDGTPKIALVTGGASGIGRACSILLAQNGAKVVIGDLPSARGRFDKWIASDGAELAIEFQELDVTKEVEWTKVMEHIETTYGTLDILVNNAGIYSQPEPELADLSMDVWRKHFAVNVDGTFVGTREAIKLMSKKESTDARSIVNISSVAGIVGFADLPTYSATKGAVRLFTKSSALYCAKKKLNIRVNSVHPGGIDVLDDKADVMGADTVAAIKEAMQPALKTMHPIGRGGLPSDVANAVLFLASESSSFMTGSEVVVDGGLTAQ